MAACNGTGGQMAGRDAVGVTRLSQVRAVGNRYFRVVLKKLTVRVQASAAASGR
jgi:hypothetical protein